MKNIILTIAIFISVYSFSQSNNSISGKLTDTESNSVPLVFANVIIKETGAKTTTNEKGLYKFENLKEGSYTLTYNFTGYETKEINIEVVSGTSKHINLALQASTLSLDDLMLVMASVDNKTTTTKTSN